jgi:hypothetical protein
MEALRSLVFEGEGDGERPPATTLTHSTALIYRGGSKPKRSRERAARPKILL